MSEGKDGPAGEFWTQDTPAAVRFYSAEEGLTVYWIDGIWLEVDAQQRILPGMLHVGECETEAEAINAGWGWLNEAEREAAKSYGSYPKDSTTKEGST